MKETSLSSSTRALLDAAKSDAPGAAARMKMWGAVSGATGLAAAAQGALSTGAAAQGSVAAGVVAASSAKLLVAGAVFGSALTVGIALAVVRVVSSGGLSSTGAGVERPVAVEARAGSAEHPSGAHESGGASTVADDAPPIPLAFSTLGTREGAPWVTGPASTTASRATGAASSGGGVRPATEDPLWREESLILEARGALRRGNPDAALASLDAAQRLGTHKLEPEELSVRVKTLRALGRSDEADEVFRVLVTRYPDQAR
jgi:hypothetical protein